MGVQFLFTWLYHNHFPNSNTLSDLNNLTKLHEPYLHGAETNRIGSSSCPCPWHIGFEHKKKNIHSK